MRHNTKRYTGTWPRITLILAELEAASWLHATVHRLRRHDGEWLLIVSTRQR